MILSNLLLGTGSIITGFAILPDSAWTKGLYMAGVGGLLGLLLTGQFKLPSGDKPKVNRVNIILEDNGLSRVKGQDLLKTKMSIRDVAKYGDILGIDLVSGADTGHTYKWVDRYGNDTIVSSSHKVGKNDAWKIYKDLAQKNNSYGFSRADLYQIHHHAKRIKQKYTE